MPLAFSIAHVGAWLSACRSTLAHTIAAVLSCAMGVTSETVLLSAHILSEGYSVAWRSVFRSSSFVGDASLDQFIGVCLT